MIRRRWVATCDADGCSACVVLEGDQYDGRWELGVQISDLGWDAQPGRDSTLCPEHSPMESTSANGR